MTQVHATRRILGIDPGYDRVGWGIVQSDGPTFTVVAYGCIQTAKSDPLIERYRQIDRELEHIVVTYQPTDAAIESIFFAKNQTTAMHVAEARGVIISCLFRHQLGYGEYTPLQIKQAVTGFGKADKAAVEKMIRLQLKLNQAGGAGASKDQAKVLDDALDALAVSLTHASRRY